MKELFVQNITPAQAYQLFLSDPTLCQAFINEAYQLEKEAQMDTYSNEKEVILHANLLFTLAYAFEVTQNRSGFFQLVREAL